MRPKEHDSWVFENNKIDYVEDKDDNFGKPKFEIGDLVYVSAKLTDPFEDLNRELGVSEEFINQSTKPCGKEAFIATVGCSGDYGLYFKDGQYCAWYEECDLSLVKKGQGKVYSKIKNKNEEEDRKMMDIDWIFENRDQLIDKKEIPTACIYGLYRQMFGNKSMWGDAGEGVTYYWNMQFTWDIAKDFLKRNDKKSFLNLAEFIRFNSRQKEERNR